ncbi:unnamed protein product [Diatraea saccharalis]|uniref:Uncharacterized protein n=1 Tax=Diatraea saccharalis TaxID=40085 RepID=A0A9N9QWW5_9NEOP|nr:unnamed protein product [Diatraea saccharalis]
MELSGVVDERRGPRSLLLSNFCIRRSRDRRLNIVISRPTVNLCASEGTLSCYFWLHLESLLPYNPHWASVEGHGPSSLTIHREGLSAVPPAVVTLKD